ncbi:MAG TPA: c-type cytochrome domain-containing protein, partial [Candidatus Cybelea sp.]|nr:c-type cytochrome domain-containing protein [Candidatus Cybelea sp.]
MKIFILPLALFVCLAQTKLAAANVDFTTQVSPIFEKSCISCHGPEKQKGKLRLDSKAAAFKGGEDGVVLIAGDAAKSDLYRRIILAEGTDDVMPNKGDVLTKAQTDLIRDWINQGAAWPETAPATVAQEKPAQEPDVPVVDFKPGAAELKAAASLQAMGIELWPVAAGLHWHEANLRSQGDHNIDAALAQLKDTASLVSLNLAGAKFSGASLANLKSLTNLTQLHLEHTQVQDADLANVSGLVRLTYLNLYDTPIMDAGLDHLKGLTNLRHLHLWQTQVTDAGAAGLQKSLPHCDIDRGWVS